MESLCISFAAISCLGMIALGYWWVVRTPGDGYIKDITRGPWGGGI